MFGGANANMSLFVMGIIIDSVILIILIALQGKNSEDISSAILGGDRDLDLFKEKLKNVELICF